MMQPKEKDHIMELFTLGKYAKMVPVNLILERSKSWDGLWSAGKYIKANLVVYNYKVASNNNLVSVHLINQYFTLSWPKHLVKALYVEQ